MMFRLMSLAIVWGVVCGGIQNSRGEDPKPATTPTAPKAPDWSKFVQVADIVGEVTQVEKNKLTLRVTWYAPQAQQGGNQNPRPQLTRPGQLPQMRRPNTPRPPQMKEMHADHELTFADEGLVRFNTLPPKFDEKGKRIAYTLKEMEDLKKPFGTKGFAADLSDLKPGTLAEVVVVRPRDILPVNAKEEDLRIKLLVILGEVANPSPAPKKKN
jgi:hypothetical protein